MNFLVVGAGFSNKGAFLMLLSLVDKLNQCFENPNIYVSPLIGDKEIVSSLGLKELEFPLERFAKKNKFSSGLAIGELLLKFKLNKYFKNYNCECFNDIDAVFDISGLEFSDLWGATSTINLNRFLNFLKKRNIKYVFMPQSFGPFNRKIIKKPMKQALEKADLVFARDEESYKYVKELANNSSKIEIYPDITIGFKKETESLSHQNPYCCIVPNIRMMDQGKSIWGESYQDILVKMVNYVLEKTDFDVYLVIHANKKNDKKLVDKVAELNNDRIKYYEDDEPLVIKDFIGKSQFLIGSRFHSLVSALSSNVPGIGLGWAHKYEMLFNDYEMQGFVIESPETFDINIMDKLIDNVENSKLREVLNQKNILFIEQHNKMWKKIIETINN